MAVRTFKTEAALRAWYRANHDKKTELWVKIYKKASGMPTVTLAQALDLALCYGWIDGIRKALDDRAFLQRYSPRTRRSMWSQINRDHVARLIADGRMTPAGQRQIDAARADGRWGRAYAPIRTITVEDVADDLRAAIEANPRARRAFKTLNRQSLFALVFRTNNMKTPEGRARKIAELVGKLARGEPLVRQP